MKYFIGILVGFIFIGCSIVEVKPPITEYTLSIHSVNKTVGGNIPKKSIKVLSSFSSTKLKTLNMNYMQGKNKIYEYSKSMWSSSPNYAINAEIVKALKDSGIFKSVQITNSRAKSDLILETYIEKFIQHFNDTLDSSYVEVAITFSVLDAKTNKLLETKSFYKKQKVKTLDANGGVEALSEVLASVLYESIDWFKKVER